MTIHRLIGSLISLRQNQYYDPLTNKTFDLAYILPNVIVCSGPVDDQLHKHYKPNRLDEITKFLDLKHGKGNHKFFNFRSEKLGYNDDDVNLQISYFPFVDHEAPRFQLILEIIEHLDRWLSSDPNHVAVLHCKAGKGRSGTIACCYLMFKDNKLTPNSANEYFSHKRFNDFFTNYGVSILSQRRYINYYYHYLNNSKLQNKMNLSNTTVVKTKISKITINGPLYRSLIINLKTYDGKDLIDCIQLTNPSEFNQSTAIYENDQLISATDIRISFQYFFIESQIMQVPLTFCFLWFNSLMDLYGAQYVAGNSSMINRILTGDNMVILQNMKTLSWDEFDGFMGTYHRGLTLFKSIEISYEIQYKSDEANTEFVSTCQSEPPIHGSHLRRILSYHRNSNI